MSRLPHPYSDKQKKDPPRLKKSPGGDRLNKITKLQNTSEPGSAK